MPSYSDRLTSRSKGTLSAVAPEIIDFSMISGAGEGIRTLDPNLGKGSNVSNRDLR